MLPSLSELLPEEKKRLNDLEEQVDILGPSSSYSCVNDVSLGLSEMVMRFDYLDKLAKAEPKERREDCNRRIKSLMNIHKNIKSNLDQWMKKHGHTFESQRRDLFGSADLEGGMGEAEVRENSSLGNSSRMMNDYLAVGQETLGNLLSQRDRIKGVQRKVLDIMNYLGLSNSIMKVVERRDSVDKWIVYIGMFLITVLVFFVFWCFRR